MDVVTIQSMVESGKLTSKQVFALMRPMIPQREISHGSPVSLTASSSDRAVKELHELIDIQVRSINGDEYMRGLANGLILAGFL